MTKYFVIVPIIGEQPLEGTVEAVDKTVAETTFLHQQSLEMKLIGKTLGTPIVERISPLMGDKYDPKLEFNQMKLAWTKYYEVPRAVRLGVA